MSSSGSSSSSRLTGLLIRFSVSSYSDARVHIGVVGSTPELGSWDVKQAVHLHPYSRPVEQLHTLNVPTLYIADVYFDNNRIKQAGQGKTDERYTTLTDVPTLQLTLEDFNQKTSSSSASSSTDSMMSSTFFYDISSSITVARDLSCSSPPVVSSPDVRSLTFEFKFIRWTSPVGPLPITPILHPPLIPCDERQQESAFSPDSLHQLYTPGGSLAIFLPLCSAQPQLLPVEFGFGADHHLGQSGYYSPTSLAELEWEGSGSSTNRVFNLDPQQCISVQLEKSKNDEKKTTMKTSYLLCVLPCTSFLNSGNMGAPSEYEHTKKYAEAIYTLN